MEYSYVDGKERKTNTPLENTDGEICIDCYYDLEDWNTHRWVDTLGDFVCKSCFNYYKNKQENR